MANYKDYREQIHLAVFRFQYLEELMRLCLRDFEKSIQQSVAGKFPFSLSAKINKKSYGELVYIFSRFNPEPQLQERLEGLEKDRNFVAHQSFLMDIESVEPTGWENLVSKATKIATTAHECVGELVKLGERIQKFHD